MTPGGGASAGGSAAPPRSFTFPPSSGPSAGAQTIPTYTINNTGDTGYTEDNEKLKTFLFELYKTIGQEYDDMAISKVVTPLARAADRVVLVRRIIRKYKANINEIITFLNTNNVSVPGLANDIATNWDSRGVGGAASSHVGVNIKGGSRRNKRRSRKGRDKIRHHSTRRRTSASRKRGGSRKNR
jgi:hypothetical protein